MNTYLYSRFRRLFKRPRPSWVSKSCGIDTIPADILKNDNCTCYNTGIISSEWGKVILTPIPKFSNADRRDPLSYREIALFHVQNLL
jgi:hypothetical protein